MGIHTQQIGLASIASLPDIIQKISMQTNVQLFQSYSPNDKDTCWFTWMLNFTSQYQQRPKTEYNTQVNTVQGTKGDESMHKMYKIIY